MGSFKSIGGQGEGDELKTIAFSPPLSLSLTLSRADRGRTEPSANSGRCVRAHGRTLQPSVILSVPRPTAGETMRSDVIKGTRHPHTHTRAQCSSLPRTTGAASKLPCVVRTQGEETIGEQKRFFFNPRQRGLNANRGRGA